MSAVSTRRFVEIGSTEGRKFLRSVAKSDLPWRNEWHLLANQESGWKVTFQRLVEGDIGEADAIVTVETDSKVNQWGETGRVRPFGDAQEVILPKASIVRLSGHDTKTAAKLLLDRWSLSVSHSCGSTHSSQHGLAFIDLQFVKGYDTVVVGTTSVFVNGVFVIRGACE